MEPRNVHRPVQCSESAADMILVLSRAFVRQFANTTTIEQTQDEFAYPTLARPVQSLRRGAQANPHASSQDRSYAWIIIVSAIPAFACRR
jgi:hypothetical protein